MNPIKQLAEHGQSVWLDYIRRNLIESGELQRLIREDGLRGVTSNPAIFEKAIAGSGDYESSLDSMRGRGDAKSLYERLAIDDIQQAADLLAPIHVATGGRDGYVSLEVSPHLARDARGTCDEARRLWREVARENLMIKVPATPEGITAMEQLIGEGLNVNVTLLFSVDVYARVAEAYLRGLERRLERGGDVGKVASVASFFVSRIDSAIDTLLAERLKAIGDAATQTSLRQLGGKAAIANAKLAYARYLRIFSGPRWQALADRGARTQRLLWASTGAKNAKYRDVVYVEELIGPETVNTIPPATYDAFREHGRVRPSLREGLAEATETMAALARLDIDFDRATDALLDEGLRLFAEAFDKLIAAVETRCARASAHVVKRQTWTLPPVLAAKLEETLQQWQASAGSRRLWARDAALWTGDGEGEWLGWLSITEDQQAHFGHLQRIAEEARQQDVAHTVLLGMGGSSLCPDVLKRAFGRIDGFPELHVLDSTDPAQIAHIENEIDPARTLFIVSSKSGGTLEPNILKDYFLARVRDALGADRAGTRFIAITDPGSGLEQVARREGFSRIFHGHPGIGGRYSALSDFGMVPAAAMGLDVRRLLNGADEMVHACAVCVPVEDNPGVVLGAILGVLGDNGRDKVTFVISPGLASLGAWLEQLLAESTGKQGKGLIPVHGERVGAPGDYGNDRVFVYLRLDAAPDRDQDAAIARLEQAGQPVVRIAVADAYGLGQEFFRWEFATAVAGSILGINPFDQPDVEASKVATRDLTARYETTGALPRETPLADDGAIGLFADARNAAELATAVGNERTLPAYLKAHLDRLVSGDYFAILAYLPMGADIEAQLQDLRHRVRDRKRVATCLGFGPRFLHSTGQVYKGGPNSGVFLQITGDDARDLPVPGKKYSFGLVKTAQALGDFQVLAERGRRVLHLHLGQDIGHGLNQLRELFDRALTD